VPFRGFHGDCPVQPKDARSEAADVGFAM